MTTIPIALPIDGIRTGTMGSLPMDKTYMAGVRSRARMLAKACALKRPAPEPVISTTEVFWVKVPTPKR